jgi:hypothetical protein
VENRASDLFLDPEDGGDMFLRKIGCTRRYIPEDSMNFSYVRRQGIYMPEEVVIGIKREGDKARR